MAATPPFTALQVACVQNPPRAVLVLGSGLGQVAHGACPELSVPFSDVPGLVAPSVEGHGGQLILGHWAGVRVLVFQGRLHRYEGHSWELVTRPMRVAAALGAKTSLFTNAAGGIRDDLVPGALMALDDHLDWTRPWPWRGEPRLSPYSPRLREGLVRAAARADVRLVVGTYAAVLGPSYETPAEIRALRSCRADAVGMSTTREAVAAVEAGLECAAVSCITNRAAGLSPHIITHEEVLATCARVRPGLMAIIQGFLQEL